jgi:hypothetical protein
VEFRYTTFGIAIAVCDGVNDEVLPNNSLTQGYLSAAIDSFPGICGWADPFAKGHNHTLKAPRISRLGC